MHFPARNHTMHTTESRFVAGQSAILFGGVYVCTFQPGNFTGCGSEGVNQLSASPEESDGA